MGSSVDWGTPGVLTFPLGGHPGVGCPSAQPALCEVPRRFHRRTSPYSALLLPQLQPEGRGVRVRGDGDPRARLVHAGGPAGDAQSPGLAPSSCPRATPTLHPRSLGCLHSLHAGGMLACQSDEIEANCSVQDTVRHRRQGLDSSSASPYRALRIKLPVGGAAPHVGAMGVTAAMCCFASPCSVSWPLRGASE